MKRSGGGRVVDLAATDFAAWVGDNPDCVLEFWAPWCSTCRPFAQVFATLAEANPAWAWGRIDTDAEQALTALFAVSSLPTVIIIRSGRVVARRSGVMRAALIQALLDEFAG